MRNESEIPFADNPFSIPVADRLKRLPPYLFGKINKLKYQKRVEGVDVIDLGMGNPTDAPDAQITDKLKEALLDPKNHRYSVANGIASLRREVAKRYDRKYGVKLNGDDEVIACLGSKEAFSHMCLALMGPGDTAIVPAPTFPIHAYSVMLASGNVIALDVRDPSEFLRNVAYTCEHLYPKPKLVVANFPHNPSGTCIEQKFFDELVVLAKRYKFLVISDFAYADICYDGYQAPSFLKSPGAIGDSPSASASNCCLSKSRSWPSFSATACKSGRRTASSRRKPTAAEAKPIASVDVCNPPALPPDPSCITFGDGPAKSSSLPANTLLRLTLSVRLEVKATSFIPGSAATPVRFLGRQQSIWSPDSSVLPTTIRSAFDAPVTQGVHPFSKNPPSAPA